MYRHDRPNQLSLCTTRPTDSDCICYRHDLGLTCLSETLCINGKFPAKTMLINEINQYTNFWQRLCMWYTTYSLSTYTCPCFSSRVLFHIEYSGRWISIKFTWSFCYLPLFRIQVTVTDLGRSWFVYNSKQIIPIFHSLCCTAGRSDSIHCVTQRVENTDMQICMKSLSPLFLLFSLKQG